MKANNIFPISKAEMLAMQYLKNIFQVKRWRCFSATHRV